MLIINKVVQLIIVIIVLGIRIFVVSCVNILFCVINREFVGLNPQMLFYIQILQRKIITTLWLMLKGMERFIMQKH